MIPSNSYDSDWSIEFNGMSTRQELFYGKRWENSAHEYIFVSCLNFWDEACWF